jgi:DNA-binding transcriptional LysR family regulator
MDLARVDLNLLLAFEALYAARGVGRAAETLGLRQPAMSAALSRLRRLFGDELFVRAGGEMRPTPKATRLAPGIAAALGQLRATLGPEAAFEPATAERAFALAVTDYAAAVLGPPLVAAVRAEAPGVDLRILAYDKDDVGDLIARGVVDLAVGVFADPADAAVVTPLFEERFTGVAPRGHPALAAALDAATFAGFDHALYTVRRDATGAVDMALAELGLRRRVALTAPYLLALPPLIESGGLVAALPERAAARICGPGLATFPLPLRLAPWRLQMLWSPFARTDRGAAWLRATVVRVAAKRSTGLRARREGLHDEKVGGQPIVEDDLG